MWGFRGHNLMITYYQDPDAILDYEMDWSEWLSDGDTIASSTWIVPEGVTTAGEANTTTTATVWLSGGVAHSRYRVTNRIVTAGGRQNDCSFDLCVQER